MRLALFRIIGFALLIIFMPLAAAAGLVSAIFNLKSKVSAHEVAGDLRNFIEGSGGAYDWDDFTSVPIANPELEDIRQRAAAVDLPVTEEGRDALRHLLAEAERFAKLEPLR